MSGYGKLQARKIITAGLTGYENMKATARRRGVEIHQSAAQGAIQRRRDKDAQPGRELGAPGEAP